MPGLDLKNKRITVTGGAGFLGSHLVQALQKAGAQKIYIPRSQDSDLKKLSVCRQIAKNSDIIIHLAAKVGGIGANMRAPYDFFFDNLMMGAQLFEEARRDKIAKFVTIGTVCAYPKHTPVPFKEEDLWNGYPEETNAPYGLAKKMLLVQGQAATAQYGFNSIYLLPVNLYGPGDNFDPATSHVIPAMIRKFIEAKTENLAEVVMWGTGKATREFLYVEDAAEGIVKATQLYEGVEPINLGSGMEISIKELASKIKELTGFKGKILWDESKPDGQPRRCLDTSKAEKLFKFKAKTSFDQGLKRTINWYLKRL